MERFLDLDAAEWVQLGPVRYSRQNGVLEFTKTERKRAALKPRCISVFNTLADNLSRNVARSRLSKHGRGPTHLKGIICEIRKTLKEIDAQDDLYIPEVGDGAPYSLKWLTEPDSTAEEKRYPYMPEAQSDKGSKSHHEVQIIELGLERVTSTQDAAVSQLWAQNLATVDIQLKLLQQRLATPSALKVFNTWTEADVAIINARKKVTIIDSYYDEHPRLEWLLGEMVNRECAVSIHMASPAVDFGAQRQREWEIVSSNEYSEALSKLTANLSDDDRMRYEFNFEKVCGDIMRCAKKKGIVCTVFEYPTMLSLRFIVIDDKQIIWGWYPLFDMNPNYPCLYLSAEDGLEAADKDLFEKLMMQVEHIRNVSVPRISSKDRLHLNFYRNICKNIGSPGRLRKRRKVSIGRK